MASPDDAERVHAETLDQWSAWLTANTATARRVWLVSWKKHTGRPAITYDEAVTEALAWGWVDNLGKRLDDDRSLLRFVPRKPGSGWSRPNKERVARLEAEGRMQPPGAAVVAAARADRSWVLLDEVEALVVPPDLADAFARHPGAAEQWEAFTRTVKRALLVWITSAKRPTTRAQRVEETAARAALGQRGDEPRP
jgi:uncharacterized protein YdeI (YjbR/CyaY-like superfamily)